MLMKIKIENRNLNRNIFLIKYITLYQKYVLKNFLDF